MHGTVENLNDIVISTDDYELYRVNRGSFACTNCSHWIINCFSTG